ncbi:MAG: FAD-binding protein [Dehalococcoidia bacterium]|nr:FAD-binding protein [Dehalococcoidia bacterium]
MSTTTQPTTWDEEAEVVIVGYGGAGAAAAITAHDVGAKVLILEKQPSDTPTVTHHTPNTRLCGGVMLSPSDVEAAVQYFEAMVKAANEVLDDERKALIRVLAQNLAENEAWMEKLGMQWAQNSKEISPAFEGTMIIQTTFDEKGRALTADYPEFPGFQSMTTRFPKTQGALRDGAAVWKCLADNVAKRRIPIMWESPAKGLVIESGEVKGVIAERNGKRLAVKASKAVVLTTGGLEANEWMKQNYLRVYPCHFYGSRASTGDGINLALQAGAALWHMNCFSGRGMIKTPDFAFSCNPMPKGEVFVDKRGKRFARETYRGHAFGLDLIAFESAIMRYPRIPFFWIFDEKRKRAGPIALQNGPCNPPNGISGPGFHPWSRDNEVEIAKGWITKAAGVSELASKLSANPLSEGMMSPSALVETIRTYNSYCHRGEDLDFQRPAFSLLPLEDPPYYAVPLWPGGANTMGGPKRNTKAQIVRPDNSPIPRLYSAGELGSVWSTLGTAGGATGECYAFGRIAGSNAAAEQKWG